MENINTNSTKIKKIKFDLKECKYATGRRKKSVSASQATTKVCDRTIIRCARYSPCIRSHQGCHHPLVYRKRKAGLMFPKPMMPEWIAPKDYVPPGQRPSSTVASWMRPRWPKAERKAIDKCKSQQIKRNQRTTMDKHGQHGHMGAASRGGGKRGLGEL